MRASKVSIILLVISFGVLAAQKEEEATLTKVGQVAPEFTVEQIDGTKFDLAKQRGSVVVLNLRDVVRPVHCRTASAGKGGLERIRKEGSEGARGWPGRNGGEDQSLSRET